MRGREVVLLDRSLRGITTILSRPAAQDLSSIIPAVGGGGRGGFGACIWGALGRAGCRGGGGLFFVVFFCFFFWLVSQGLDFLVGVPPGGLFLEDHVGAHRALGELFYVLVIGLAVGVGVEMSWAVVVVVF